MFLPLVNMESETKRVAGNKRFASSYFYEYTPIK